MLVGRAALLIVLLLGQSAAWAQEPDPLDTDPLQAAVKKVQDRKELSVRQALDAPRRGMEIYEAAAKDVKKGGTLVPIDETPGDPVDRDPGFPWGPVLVGTFIVGGIGYMVVRSLTEKPPAPPEEKDLPSVYTGD